MDKDDRLPSNSDDGTSGRISAEPSSTAPLERVIESAEILSNASTSEIGAKERALVYVVTSCCGLAMSVGGFFVVLVWHLYNVTNGLPVNGLITDWILGTIYTPFGCVATVWIQNEAKEKAHRKAAKKPCNTCSRSR